MNQEIQRRAPNPGCSRLLTGGVACLFLLTIPALADDKKPKKAPTPTAVEEYAHAAAQQVENIKPTAGAIWTPASPFADLGRDVRASQVNDLVTIVVSE